MKLVVVRIEDQDGFGPYRTPVNWGWERTVTSYHPTPYEDCGLKTTWEGLNAIRENELWSFGFKNIEQMLSWFDEEDWLFAMRRAGLRLTYWAVDYGDAHFGERQVIFRRGKAKMFDEKQLLSDERYLQLTEESATVDLST